MYTMAFIGPSGTGKSHRSVTIANELHADAIIDDGLLISKNKILAGFSAKKEATKMAAVKRALFTQKEHVESVKAAFAENDIKSLIILGTSLRMAELIANKLDVAPIQKIIRIEDAATPEEIRAAQKMRMTEGKHVIPVPVFELKEDFSGYFLHPLRQIKKSFGKNPVTAYDKSIVRPTFSYMGKYTVSDGVVSSIAAFEAKRIQGVLRVNSVSVSTFPDGANIQISITLKYGLKIPDIARNIQNIIIKSVDYHTSVNVKRVDIFVKKLKY